MVPVATRPSVLELLQGPRGRVLWFCWIGWVFDFHDLILFSFCKRAIAAELRIDATSIAWIEGASLFASAVGAFAFGRVADRIGRRRAMTLSILVYSLGALCTGLADGVVALAFARSLAGLGVGGEWGIGHAVVGEAFDGGDRDRAHALLQSGGPFGMAIAACTGLFLAPAIGWRVVFLVSALPALLAFFARRAMPGPDAPPPRAAREGRASAMLSTAHRRATAVLFSILLLHMTGFWCVYAEMPNALMRDLGASSAQAGAYQIAVNCAHLVADVAFGWLAARHGRARTFAWMCVAFAAAQVAMALAWASLTRDLLVFTFAAAAMGFGVGTWSCFGSLFGDLYPASLRATAAAALYSMSRGAQLFAKPGSQALAEWHGTMQPALWIGAACALGSAGLYRLLPLASGSATKSSDATALSDRG